MRLGNWHMDIWFARDYVSYINSTVDYHRRGGGVTHTQLIVTPTCVCEVRR